MLKRAYIRAAQTVFAAPMRAHYAGIRPGRSPCRDGGGRWLASLGAIYHIDRMIALDIPWWNVAATRLVEAFLVERPRARVFEFGSGASTVWLARRAHEILTVEHDADWAERLRPRLSDYSNAALTVASFDAHGLGAEQPYVRAIEDRGSFDLIVVDGRLRNACLSAAVPALKRDGIILFDDSGRRRYRPAIEGCGLAEKRFRGLSYCVPYPDHSSILRAV